MSSDELAHGDAEPRVSVEGYRSVLNRGKRQTHRKNEIIILEGTIATRIRIIVSGWAAYCISTTEDKRRIICIVGPGRPLAVGEVIDGLPMTTSIIALTDCEVALATYGEMLETMQHDEQLRMHMFKGLSYRCRNLIESQRNCSSFIRPHDKLLGFFSSLVLSAEMGEKDGWIIVPVGLTHEIIADAIDTSRVTVSRLLAQYAKDGLIKKKDGQFFLSAKLFE